MKNVKTYAGAVAAFIAASPWLTDEDLPAVIALKKLAALLDDGDTKPATVAQFGLTYRNLQKRAPSAQADDDPLEAALNDVEH